MEEYDEELTSQFIEYLIEEGCMEVTGIEPSGEFLFSVTPKMEEIFPEIWDEIMSFSNQLVYELWQKDLVDVIFNSNGETLVTVNDNTLKYKEYELNEEQELMIETIINRMNSEDYDADDFD